MEDLLVLDFRLRWSRLTVAATTVLMFHSISNAAATALECPSSIPEKSVKLVDAPKGWTPFVGSPLYLHGAAPMSGPPASLGELADYKEAGRKPNLTYRYELDGKFPDGKWLACTYGESDQVTLSRRIADDVKICTFKYSRGKHLGQNDIVILCE